MSPAAIYFPEETPNLLAAAFLPSGTADGGIENPNPWHLLAAALDELMVSGAMARERRSGAETCLVGSARLRDASGEQLAYTFQASLSRMRTYSSTRSPVRSM